MYIPPGFTSVTPYLIIDDADKYLRFLANAFAAEEIATTRREDGSIANTQVKMGSSMLMLTQSSDFLKAMSSAYYLYVENADETVLRAVKYGAEVIMQVADMPYGDRQGGVRDPQGNIWWISQRLVAEPYTT